MKVRTEAKDLAAAVTTASKAISNRATLPVLSGVRLRANGTLEVAATDLEQAIFTHVPAASDEEGSCIIEAKALKQALKGLTGEVRINADDHEAEVISGRRSIRLKAIATDDYPLLTSMVGKVEASAVTTVGALRTALSRTIFAASDDESRQILCGVLFQQEARGSHAGKLMLAATDSYRLAVTEVEGTTDGEIRRVLDPRRLVKLLPAKKPDAVVRIFFLAEGSTLFIFNGIAITIRHVEGEFPKYRQLIPEGYPNTVDVETEAFAEAIRNVEPMAQNNLPVKLHIGQDEIEVSAHTPDVGEARDYVPCSNGVEGAVLAFNPAFLLQMCKANPGVLTIEFADGLKPTIFKSDDAHITLQMPVRLT